MRSEGDAGTPRGPAQPIPDRPESDAAVWAAVRQAAAGTRYMAALLGELTCLGIAQGTARLVGPRPMVQAARAKAADIEGLFRQAVGRPIKVVIEGAGAPLPEDPREAPLRAGGPPPSSGGSAAPAAEPDPTPAVPRAPIQEHPLVRQAIEQLGATFVRAQPRVRPAGET